MRAHDQAVKSLPERLAAIHLCTSLLDAAQGADALVIATEWPDYQYVSFPEVLGAMQSTLIIDANRFLSNQVEILSDVTYVTVGKGVKE